MKSMSIVGQNDKGETKFERPIVIGKRDVMILQYPREYTAEEVEQLVETIDQAVNGESDDDGISIIGFPDDVKIRVLRIDN